MKGKKTAAIVLAAALLLGLSACGPRARKGTVYWLNDDADRNAAALALADQYERETGVTVKVITPAEGEYESRLAAGLDRRDPPTLFSVREARELPDWEEDCLDLGATELAASLRTDVPLLRGEDGVLRGIGCEIASYGLIVNKTLLERAGHRVSEIGSFEDLRRVAEDIQARSDALGFCAFTSAGLERDSAWRFTRQLFSLPVTLEYRDRPAIAGEPVLGTYLKYYRNLLDLYYANGPCAGTELEEKTVEDARKEFLSRRAVFYQNGSWEYQALIQGGLRREELTMIPLYIGAPGEEDQGLCTDAAGYWCVNRNAEEENLRATLDFLRWCIADQERARVLGVERAFFDPAENENVFAQADSACTAEGKAPVEWNQDVLPGESWERNAVAALTAYAAAPGSDTWAEVRTALVGGWSAEAKRK